MHSIVIALNEHIADDELFEMMPNGVDYVIEQSLDSEWVRQGKEILVRIGTVKNENLHVDFQLVRNELEKMWVDFQTTSPQTFEEYVDRYKMYRVMAAIDDDLNIQIYSDYAGLTTWAYFLRMLWNNGDQRKELSMWKIAGIYDYHY